MLRSCRALLWRTNTHLAELTDGPLTQQTDLSHIAPQRSVEIFLKY